VQSTGLLAPDAVDKALHALRRFRTLCDIGGITRLWCVATAACRDAENGPEFIAAAERICRKRIDVLTGKQEAQYSALGVISGFYRPDGIVGDLGGGSLELVDVHGQTLRSGVTLPLGSLALQDLSEKSLKKAEKIVRKTLGKVPLLKRGEGRSFYAVGGTWRALARLHMWQTGYPAARDARLRHSGARGTGILAAGAPGQSRDALAHRDGERGTPSAARLCGLGARARRADRAPARHRDLGARRARGPALFGIAGARARQGTGCSRPPRNSMCCARARPRMARS
jgi:hypothetical protein